MAIETRVVVLLVAMQLVSLRAHAQASLQHMDSFYFGGIRAGIIKDANHADDKLYYIELVQGRLGKDYLCYQVKAGRETQRQSFNADLYYTTNTMSYALIGQAIYQYFAEGYYVKPGYIFCKKIDRGYTWYLSANVNITYVVHTLRVTIPDQVYGDAISEYKTKRLNFFSSVEVEHVQLFRLFRLVDLSLAYYIGYKIPPADLFSNVVPTYSKPLNYVPGVAAGNTLYFNFAAGLNIRF